MINDEVEKCYYFAVKNLLELYSFEWLRSKKAAIRLAYKSKYNHKRKNQVILLMITDGNK